MKWASSREAQVIRLLVTAHNATAIAFYERLGFSRTGRTEPYANDPTVLECEMERPIP
jgi:ribosomal protein S18 acetylase RimI-like enzyme